MAKFKFPEILLDGQQITARTADGAGAANQLTDKDQGKLLKLVGDSQYGLTAAGDEIEGVLIAPDYPAPADGYNLGTVQKGGRIRVTFGVVLAINDKVVAGTQVARGTSLNGAPPTVQKAAAATTHTWRVVSLDGTTAAGQTGLIEKV